MSLEERLRRLSKRALELGQKAGETAMEEPWVRRRVEKARTSLLQIQRKIEGRLEALESELWARVQKLQEEAQKAGRQAQRRRSSKQHYEVLGLSPGASLEEIKQAWRAKMRAHHPDHFAHDPQAEAAAHQEALKINLAYQELNVLLSGRESRRA